MRRRQNRRQQRHHRSRRHEAGPQACRSARGIQMVRLMVFSTAHSASPARRAPEHRSSGETARSGRQTRTGSFSACLPPKSPHKRNRTRAKIFDQLTHELGVPFYERIDAPATPEQKDFLNTISPDQIDVMELAGEPIHAKLTTAPGNGIAFGGIKVVAKNGWFAARSSGTEEIYKIYAESFRNEDHLRQIQQEAQETIARAFERAKARPPA